MATPITWRNVDNTVTGNPAAALSAATSAFAVAGENARANVKGIQEREKLDREKVNRAAAGLFLDKDGATDADLASLKGQDIDYASLYKDRGAIDLQAAQTAKFSEDVRSSLLLNSPERVKELDALEQSLGQAQVAKIMEDIRVSSGLHSETAIADYLGRLNEAHRSQIANDVANRGLTGANQAAVETGTESELLLQPGLVPQQTATREATQAGTANVNQDTTRSQTLTPLEAGAIVADTDLTRDRAANVRADTDRNVRTVDLDIQQKTEDVKATAAGTELTKAQIEGRKADTIAQMNLNDVFDEKMDMSRQEFKVSMEGLNLDNKRTEQVITQDGKKFTQWEKDQQRSENTHVALAKLQSLSPAQKREVQLDPGKWFSKFKDVNTSVLIDYLQGDDEHRSRMVSESLSQVNQAQNNRWDALTKTPENARLFNRNEEITVELNENRNRLTKNEITALEDEQINLRGQREKAIEAENTKNTVDRGFQEQVSQYMAGIKKQVQDERQEILAAQSRGEISAVEAAALIQDGEELKILSEQDYREGPAPLGFLQDFKEANRGASIDGINLSEVAQTVAGRQAEAQALRQVTHTEEQKRKTELMKLYDSAAAGNDYSAFSYNAATGHVEVLAEKDREANKINLGEAERDVSAKAFRDGNSRGGLDWLGRDSGGKLTKESQAIVKDLVKAVGYNREIWNQVLDAVNYNIQLFRDDKIDNIPTTGEIMDLAQKYKEAAGARAKAMGESRYQPASYAEQLAKWRSIAGPK